MSIEKKKTETKDTESKGKLVKKSTYSKKKKKKTEKKDKKRKKKLIKKSNY